MRIGFAAQNPRSHYWLMVEHAVRERAAELGIELATLSAYTLEQQIAIIEGFISQRVDALIIGPIAATGLADVMKRAHGARIPAIILAAQLSDATATSTVRSDHRKGAELAATYLVEQLGGAGKVAHIVGPSQLRDNIDRAAGARDVFARHPGIEIAFERESADWEPRTGAALLRAALQQESQIGGVCVANDTLALGVIEAIEAAGRAGEIAVTGFDASPDALMAIHDGRMKATVRQSIRDIGRTGVEIAQRAAWGEAVPELILTDISLVTQANLLDAALDTVTMLPGVLRDVVERGEALALARDDVIVAQKAALRELSTPLIPISDKVMVMPLIGSIDTSRAQQVIETLLQGVAANGIELVILDITGVLFVDTQVANAVIRAAQAVKLLGARLMLTGIRPEVAQVMINLEIDLGDISVQSTLQDGIAFALKR